MKIRALGIVVALLSSAGMVRADTTTALGQCVSACQLEAACSTQKCANLCELSCKHDITQVQHVFNGPVTSTPLVCTGDAGTQCGFFVSGTVANQAFCPGTVTIYQICPDDRGTRMLASGTVNADCTFSFNAPNGPGPERLLRPHRRGPACGKHRWARSGLVHLHRQHVPRSIVRVRKASN